VKKSEEELKNFNVLCWSDEAEILSRVRTNPYSIKTLPDGVRVHLTYVTEHSRPPICDCVLYFITGLEQLIEARKFRARYRHIWTHFVICALPEAKLVEEELNAEHLPEDAVAVRLLDSSSKMMQLLKGVFDAIDVDHSGGVDVVELQRTASLLSSEFSSSELEEAISAMDANKNGIIEYSEFVEWWRSGRQGAYKLSEMVDRMSRSIALQVPEAVKMLKSMRNSKLLTKEVSSKELCISIGKISSVPKLTWRLEFGTAARREQLLYQALDVFEWLSKPHCLIFAFKSVDDLDEGHLMNLITSTIELALGTLQERTLIREHIDYSVLVRDDYLYIGITLNMNLPLFKPLMKQLDPIQQLLEAPVDQSLSLSMRLENIGSLDPASLILKIEHWSKIPRYLLQSIWRFLGKIGLSHLEPVFSQSKDASLTMNFEGADELQKCWLIEQLEGVKDSIKKLSTDFATVINLYTELSTHASPDFDIYVRIENLGMRSSFSAAVWPDSLHILNLV
jgi:hypothetical protein